MWHPTVQFGTFEFLLTDLVPLQLIHEQLSLEDSNGGDDDWDDVDDEEY